MKETDNIDNLFKEGLDGFELSPSEAVWENVEGALFAAPKAVPFYRSRWMLAALILLLFSIGGWFLFYHPYTDKPKVVEQVEKPALEKVSEKETPENSVNQNSAVTNNSTLSNTKANTEANDIKSNNSYIPPVDKPKQTIAQNSETETENIIKKETISYSKEDQLAMMPTSSIYTLAALPLTGKMQQPGDILTVEQYTKKRSNLHVYTGATAEIGMIYYPATEDQVTWAANATAGLKAGKFYFETGAGYRYIRERGSYKIDFRTQDSIGYYNKVSSFEINPQNPDEIILNYKKTTVYDSIDHIAYTAPLFKYDYLTVPVRIGYRLFNRGNIFVALETGIEYSYQFPHSATQNSGHVR